MGASLVPATEAVKEARVLVAGEELSQWTPRSKTRFPMWRDCRRCFCIRALRRASCGVCEGAAAIFGEGESAFSSRDGSGDGVGDAAQTDIGDGVAIVEVEIDRSHRVALLMTSFSLDPSRISAVVTEIGAVVGIRSFRISEGDGASDIEVGVPSVNVPEEELQGDGGSVIGACDGGGEGGEGACGGRGVGVSDAEIEDAISRCGGIVGGVFVFESVEESFCLCVCEVPPPSLAKVRVLSPPVTEAVTE